MKRNKGAVEINKAVNGQMYVRCIGNKHFFFLMYLHLWEFARRCWGRNQERGKRVDAGE